MAENSAAPRRRGIAEVRKIFREFRKRIGGDKKTSDTPQTLSGQHPLRKSLLYDVPPEILRLYSSFLDDASLACLSYTSKALKDFFNLDPASFGKCLRWVITSRLEQGALVLSKAGKQPYPKEFCCMACKRKHPRYQFDGETYRRLFPQSTRQFYDQHLMNLPPVERVCGFRRPRFQHVSDSTTGYTFLDPSGRPITMAERTWLKLPILVCTHCDEGVSMAGSDEPVCRNPLCRCTACLKVLRPTYLRFGPLFTSVLEIERFKYDSKGKLRIIERGANGYPTGPVLEVANPFQRPATQ